MTATPCAPRGDSMTSTRRSNSCGVRLEVGSSIAITRAFASSALAISTIWRCATRSVPIGARDVDRRVERGRAPRAARAPHARLVGEDAERASSATRGTCSARRRAGEPAAVPGGSCAMPACGPPLGRGRDERLVADAGRRPAVGAIDAGEDLEERRLAGAVLAEQRDGPRPPAPSRLTSSSACTPGKPLRRRRSSSERRARSPGSHADMLRFLRVRSR